MPAKRQPRPSAVPPILQFRPASLRPVSEDDHYVPGMDALLAWARRRVNREWGPDAPLGRLVLSAGVLQITIEPRPQ